jgi:hypothetical protein
MTALPILPESRWRSGSIAVALCIVMVAVLLAAGCMTTSASGSLTGNPTQTPVSPIMEKSVTFYKVTIPQPEGIHPDYIKIDSDVYNLGEVIEFHVVNEGSEPLACWQITPSLDYHLYRQIGTWELQPEPYSTGWHTDSGYYLQHGESTPELRLRTADLIPGHYKIVTDCGVSREFEIRAAPNTTQ